MNSKEVLAKDFEYMLEEVEIDNSSEDEDAESIQNIRSLKPRSKKVMAVNVRNLEKSVDKHQNSTTSMSSMLKKRSQARKDQEQQKKDKEKQNKVLTPLHCQAKELGQVPLQGESQQKISMPIPPQEKEVQSNISKKQGKSKTLVAPRSLGAYVRLKEKSREQLSRQTNASQDNIGQLRYDLSLDQVTENSQKQRPRYSGCN